MVISIFLVQVLLAHLLPSRKRLGVQDLATEHYNTTKQAASLVAP